MTRDWSVTYHRPRRPVLALAIVVAALSIPMFAGLFVAKPYWRQQRYWPALAILAGGTLLGINAMVVVEYSLARARGRRIARVWQGAGLRTLDPIEESLASRSIRPAAAQLEMTWAAAASEDGTTVVQTRMMESLEDKVAMISCRLEAVLPECAILNVGENDWLYKPLAGVRATIDLVETAGRVEIRSNHPLTMSPSLRALVGEMRPDEAVIVESDWLHVLWIGPLSEEGMRQLIARRSDWVQALREAGEGIKVAPGMG